MRSLRIFYAAHPSPNVFVTPNSQLWRQNLYEPLVDLGHDVVEFDYDLTPHFRNLDTEVPRMRAFTQKNRPMLERELLRQIEAAHRQKPIDIFFSYFYSACVTPATIRKIHDLGITTVNWYCNGAHQFHLVEEIAPAYDFCLVPEEFRLDDYRRIGANPIYSQEAANPNVYRPYSVDVEFDVVFVGQKYADRARYIRRLLDAGIDARVWGPRWRPPSLTMSTAQKWRGRLRALTRREGWRAAVELVQRRIAPTSVPADPNAIPLDRVGPPLDDRALIEMYSRAKISLGFSTVGETHTAGQRMVQVRLRDFEAPMSGAFYMVEYQPEIEQFFKVGDEIVCYSDADDLLEKVRYYLVHDEERERIRQAGRARALRDHTWHRRFEVAFAKMGFD